MDWATWFQWAMQGIVGLAVLSGVRALHEVKESIQELNENMATMIERTKWHEKDIEKLDERVSKLEDR